MISHDLAARGELRRRGAGHVRRPRRRARADPQAVRARADALHAGAARRDPAAREQLRTRRWRPYPGSRPTSPTSGSAVRSRRAAPSATDKCRDQTPPFEEQEPEHRWACWHPMRGERGDTSEPGRDDMSEPLLEVSKPRPGVHRARSGRVQEPAPSTPCPTCRSRWPRARRSGWSGETGSGKSTLARSLLQAPPPKSGSVRLRGIELVGLKRQRAARGTPRRADGLPGPVRLAGSEMARRASWSRSRWSRFGMGGRRERRKRVAGAARPRRPGPGAVRRPAPAPAVRRDRPSGWRSPVRWRSTRR